MHIYPVFIGEVKVILLLIAKVSRPYFNIEFK